MLGQHRRDVDRAAIPLLALRTETNEISEAINSAASQSNEAGFVIYGTFGQTLAIILLNKLPIFFQRDVEVGPKSLLTRITPSSTSVECELQGHLLGFLV